MNLDCFRGVAECAQSAFANLYPNTVTVRTITWSGARLGDGVPSQVDLVLAKRPIKQLRAHTILASGGKYEKGDIRVTDITPFFTKADLTTGGYTLAQLDPASLFPKPNRTKEVRYVITGDLTGEYRLIELDTTDPMAWSMVLRRKTTP